MGSSTSRSRAEGTSFTGDDDDDAAAETMDGLIVEEEELHREAGYAAVADPIVGSEDHGAPASPSARCYERAVGASPDLAPLPWAVVNFVCLIWSTLLVFAIYRTEEPLHRVFGTQLYLTWNFVTTFIWCFEIGLIVLYRRRRATLIHWVELVAAVYFFQDSVALLRLVVQMEPDDDIDGELLDAVVNAGAYLYQFLDSLYIFTQRLRREGDPRYASSPVAQQEPVESLSDALMHNVHANTDDFY